MIHVPLNVAEGVCDEGKWVFERDKVRYPSR